MKKIILVFFALVMNYVSFSQYIYPQVIATAGNSFSNSQNIVDWTLGETITETLSTSNNILTQGFQQPSYFLSSTPDIVTFEIEVFPNPASDILFIHTTTDKTLHYSLTDLNGKQLKQQTFTTTTSLDLNDLARTVYLLHIIDNESRIIKTYRIVKIN